MRQTAKGPQQIRTGDQPVKSVGAGFLYRLNADMVLLRKGKRKVSEAQRIAGRKNLATPSWTRESEG